MKKGSFQWMKSLNRRIILNKIRTDGPISRATIAKETKLTPPTVSNLVTELIDAGLVIESEQGESIGGRKPTLLVVKKNSYYTIGLDVGTKVIRAVLVNLVGDLVEQKVVSIPIGISKEELLKLILQVIKDIAELHTDKTMIGIGVGMHGVIDVDKGVGLFAPGLHMRDIPLKETLEQEFGILVKVDNDVRAMALGEYWYTNGSNSENMVTVNIGRGVGAGIVLNGELFYGNHDLAGEIGHMTIDVDGNVCPCGNRGCWQTLISGPAIGTMAMHQIQAGAYSQLQEMVDDLSEIEGKTVYEAAVKGDPLSIQILEKTGEYIGIGLTNLIHLLNPTKIIIGGGVANAHSFLMPKIRETIEKRALTPQARETPITYSKQGVFGTAKGAAALILQEIFEGDLIVGEP